MSRKVQDPVKVATDFMDALGALTSDVSQLERQNRERGRDLNKAIKLLGEAQEYVGETPVFWKIRRFLRKKVMDEQRSNAR